MYEIRKTDPKLNNLRFEKLVIIEPYKYYKSGNTHEFFVKCKCDCGNEVIVSATNLICHKTTTSCGHCYDNKYEIINDVISLLKIYDYTIGCWSAILINTECVDYLKSIGNWHILHKSDGTIDIRYCGGSNGLKLLLHRTIVSYINQKYNLQPLTKDLQVDHISGNTFNNLYYPFDGYYNNLRMCTNKQNVLNTKCVGYKRNKNKYLADITINGKRYIKSFQSPQDCINYNNRLIQTVSPIDATFYYHSPTNPRNWNWTFSNTILNAIGYNDNEYAYKDNDFSIII